jgi:hypothetical protein
VPTSTERKEFGSLSRSDQIEILNQLNPEFRALPDSDKQAFPDAAIIAAFAQARGLPVLREQPSALQKAAQPGGIISPKSVGIVGGALTGAAAGAPLGPPGAILGGLIGAGVGGGIGRGGEILAEELVGAGPQAGTRPQISRRPTPGQITQDVAEATSEGIFSEAMSLITGRVGRKILGKTLFDPSKRLTPENEALRQAAEEAGLEMSAGEILESPKLALMESIPGRFPLGISSAHKFIAKRRDAVERKALEMAEEFSPGISKDFDILEQSMREVADARTAGLQSMSRKFAGQIGRVTDPATASERIVTKVQGRLAATQRIANRLYKAAEDTAISVRGPTALDAIEAPRFLEQAQTIAQKAQALRGVTTRPEKIAKAAAGTPLPGDQTVTIGGQAVSIQDFAKMGIDPASMPEELIKAFGLDETKTFSFEVLRTWQSRLGELIRTTTNRQAKRQLTQLFVAVSDDIDNLAKSIPEMKPLLDRANEFYKFRVAKTFFVDPIAKLDKADADNLAKLFIRPNGSVFPLRKLKAALGAQNYNNFIASYFQKLADDASPDGVFDVTKYLKAIAEHKPAILSELLGPRTTTLNAMLQVFKHNPTKLIDAINTREGSKILDFFAKPGAGVEPLRGLVKILPPDRMNQFRGAWLKNLVERQSRSPSGEFSIDRFLNHIAGRSGFSEPQLRLLMGRQFPEAQRLIRVLQRIGQTRGIGLNPSETARGMLSFGQISGTIQFGTRATAIGLGVLAGQQAGAGDVQGAMILGGTGLVLLTPSALGRLLFSEGGIRLLTRGLQVNPGTRLGRRIAARIVNATRESAVTPRTRMFGERRIPSRLISRELTERTEQ